MAKKVKSVKIESLLYVDQLRETISRFSEDVATLMLGFRDFRSMVLRFDGDTETHFEEWTRLLGEGISFWKSFSETAIGKSRLGEGYDDELLERIGSLLTLAFIESTKRHQQEVAGSNDEDVTIINGYDRSGYDLSLLNDLLGTLGDLQDELGKTEETFLAAYAGGETEPIASVIFEGMGLTDLLNTEGYLERIISYLSPIRDDVKSMHDRHLQAGGQDIESYKKILTEIGVLTPYDSEESQNAVLNMSYTELQHSIDELSLRLKTLVFGETGDGRADIKNEQDFLRILENTFAGDKVSDTDLSSAMPFVNELKKLQKQRNFLGALIGVENERSNIQTQINRARKYLDSRENRQLSNLQSMREFFEKCGSISQRQSTMREYYDLAIQQSRKEGKEGQARLLEKEYQQKEASLSFENISRGIDWHALFSGVGDLTKEMMAPMMEQLQAWVKTDEYRNADAETQQKVTDLIQEMRKYVGTDQSVTWQALDKAIKDFTQAVARYDEAKKAEDAAVRARNEGKKKLDAGELTPDEYKKLEDEAQRLGDATAQARADMEAFGGALNRTSEEVANFTSGLTTALSNAKGWTGADGFGNVQNAVGGIDQLKGTLDSLLPQMGDGMAKTIGTTLSSTIGSTLGSIGSGIEGLLGSGLGSIIGIVAQIPKLILDLAGAIKNFVTGILDALTELISLRWIDDLVVSILDAVGNLIDAIFDLPENLFKVLESIVVNGVGGLLDGVIGRIGNILTFGALSSSVSDWFTNSNAAEVAATIDRLTKRNELLEQAIEDLTDEMKSARGARAIDASTRARQLQEETNANYKSIAQAQASYHSAHHSWNYYWDGFSQEQIARLSGQIGRQWNGDLWDLSPEEMKMLRSNVDMWKLIADTGKGPYGESVQEKLSAYIDQAGKLQEITDALYENLTTTTKENVFDDFLGSLYDLADGSEEVMDNIADNWQKMVNRMAVNNLVGAKFQKNLEDWYENLAKLNEARTNGEITDEEYRKRLDALKAEYDGYVESAKRDIETLRTEGIVKATEENSGVTQSGKAGAFTTMSQDQAGKLEGLFVSGQMHWASMDDKLEDVTRQMDEAGDHLRQIATNTGSSAQSLGEIKEDIKKMIRDGLKMK